MSSLHQHLNDYFKYHLDPRNRLTHVVGIPLTTFAVFLVFGWFRFTSLSEWVSLSTLFFIGSIAYYIKLDFFVGFVVLLIFAPVFVAAEIVAQYPFSESIVWFAASFTFGAAIQIIGHLFEGRKPALLDNFLQVFNAPLLLACELLIFFGLRKDLKLLHPSVTRDPHPKSNA